MTLVMEERADQKPAAHTLYRGAYDQKDAAGFIRILGLPSRSRALLRHEVTVP